MLALNLLQKDERPAAHQRSIARRLVRGISLQLHAAAGEAIARTWSGCRDSHTRSCRRGVSAIPHNARTLLFQASLRPAQIIFPRAGFAAQTCSFLADVLTASNTLNR